MMSVNHRTIESDFERPCLSWFQRIYEYFCRKFIKHLQLHIDQRMFAM